MSDGSRCFWSTNAYGCSFEIWKLLKTLPIAVRKTYVSSFDEAWLEFSYMGFDIAAHDHWSGVSFFAEDPGTPEKHLMRIAKHLAPVC